MSDMSEKPKKKSLWEILNTPVQDLIKKEEETAPSVVSSSALKDPLPTEASNTSAQPAAVSVSTPDVLPVKSEPQSEPQTDPAVTLAEELPESTVSVSPEAVDTLAQVAETVPEAKQENKAELQLVETQAELSESVVSDTVQPDSDAVVKSEQEDSPKLRKKNLWEILNTPVQDLFKEGQLVVENSEDEVAFLGLGRDKPQLEGKEKQSWLEHFRSRLARTRSQFTDNINRLAKGRTKVDEDMLEELEEILLQSDVGVKTTDDVLEHLRGEAKKRRFLPEEVLPSLTGFLEQTLESEPFRLEEGKLNIFLIVGVNGTGKTTTVGKVAAKLKIGGYRVMLAAGDTFRAAAIDQLAIWGKRVGCPVIQHHEGADAAAVVFDAIQSARAKKIDALLIDTAGRLHNKDHLMEELKKVYRIIDREKQDARVECILVLDATTGQNGLRQAEVFSKSVPLKSLILTKLDGTAKGGVIFGIKRELNIPIKLLGVGEHLGDLQEFEPKSFVQALFAQDDAVESAVS